MRRKAYCSPSTPRIIQFCCPRMLLNVNVSSAVRRESLCMQNSRVFCQSACAHISLNGKCSHPSPISMHTSTNDVINKSNAAPCDEFFSLSTHIHEALCVSRAMACRVECRTGCVPSSASSFPINRMFRAHKRRITKSHFKSGGTKMCFSSRPFTELDLNVFLHDIGLWSAACLIKERRMF
jgi:hypothetical protein